MGTRLLSIVNAVGYLFTRRHLLEGRYQRWLRRYHNWDRSCSTKPERFLYPTTEQEICKAVREGRRIGVVGAGHSFNRLHLDRDTLISLDHYADLIGHDAAKQTAVFRAGTRLRDAAARLKRLNLALPVLPDHNAQSLAGILATDVHASGKPDAAAHVSQAVNYIRLVDGLGVPRDTYPGEPLFRATIGGMGCTGVIVEVGLACRAPFHLKTEAFRCSFAELLRDLDKLRADNDLVAAGYFPYIDACVVELKRRSDEPLTPGGPFWETTRDVTQAIALTLFLPLGRSRSRLVRRAGKFVLDQATKHLREHKPLVLDNFEGFNRNVYQVHSEVEFVVPLDRARDVLQEGHDLMRAHPESAHYLLGIRISRANEQTLIGPAAGSAQDQIAWIAPYLDGHDRDPQDDLRWQQLCRRFNGRPHTGKNMLGLDASYLAQEYGTRWNDFLATLAQYDPQQKFSNALTRGALAKPALSSTLMPSVARCVPPSFVPAQRRPAQLTSRGSLIAEGERDEPDHGQN
jgi:FAD/FMN-containing dehydrogenase